MQIYNVWPLSSLKKRSIALPIQLLSRHDRVRLVVVTLITTLLAFLDLVGVLLIGLIGSVSITGLSNSRVGDRASSALAILRINNLNFESQVIVLGLLAAILLMSKTILSLFLVRKTLFFMARRAAVMSSKIRTVLHLRSNLRSKFDYGWRDWGFNSIDIRYSFVISDECGIISS
jgi:hypothetical protein